MAKRDHIAMAALGKKLLLLTSILFCLGLFAFSLKQDVAQRVVFDGYVDEDQQETLRAPVGGLVQTVAVSEGQAVQAGEILFSLEAEGLKQQQEKLQETTVRKSLAVERLQALLDSRPPVFSETDTRSAHFLLAAKSLYSKQKAAYNEAGKDNLSHAEALEKDLTFLDNEIREFRQEIAAIKQEEAVLKELGGDDPDALKSLNEAKSERWKRERQLSGFLQKRQTATAALQKIAAQQEKERANVREGWQKELVRVQESLALSQKEKREVETALFERHVRAQKNTVVREIFIRSGMRVDEGGAVLSAVSVAHGKHVAFKIPHTDNSRPAPHMPVVIFPVGREDIPMSGAIQSVSDSLYADAQTEPYRLGIARFDLETDETDKSVILLPGTPCRILVTLDKKPLWALLFDYWRGEFNRET